MTLGERIAVLNIVAFHRRESQRYERKIRVVESSDYGSEYARESVICRMQDKADEHFLTAVSLLDGLMMGRA